MSQEELAALVSKSQKAMSQYENGTRRMFVADLPKFATALKVPVSYFLTGQMTLDELDELVMTEVHRLTPRWKPNKPCSSWFKPSAISLNTIRTNSSEYGNHFQYLNYPR